jgi:outer membrane lipoprotein-sorting protein
MKKYLLATLMILVLLCMTLASWHGAEGGGRLEEYSAEQVHIDSKGKIKGTSKLHVAPEKMRMEMSPPDGTGKMITIVRQDKGVYWMVMPGQKMYMERQIEEEEMDSLMQTYKDSQVEEDLGTEKVNGYECSKKRVTTTHKIMGTKRKSVITIWQSPKIDFPLKTQTEDGEITELRNIRKGRQPSKLFEPPAGYEKMENMMQMFQGMGQ